jgi:hypothetical protein
MRFLILVIVGVVLARPLIWKEYCRQYTNKVNRELHGR